jgi:hypothetical protein
MNIKFAVILFFLGVAALCGYLIGHQTVMNTHTVEIVTDSVYIRDLEQENERLTREIDSLLYGNVAENTCNL